MNIQIKGRRREPNAYPRYKQIRCGCGCKKAKHTSYNLYYCVNCEKQYYLDKDLKKMFVYNFS